METFLFLFQQVVKQYNRIYIFAIFKEDNLHIRISKIDPSILLVGECVKVKQCTALGQLSP